MIKIQATFIGYGGRACTLFSAIDPDSNVLVVSVESDYRADRMDGCIVITNNPEIPYDSLFTDDDIKAAISAFFAFKTDLPMTTKAKDWCFLSGRQDQIQNNLLKRMAWTLPGRAFVYPKALPAGRLRHWPHASRSGTIEQTLNMFDALNALSRGEIITI